MLLSLGAAVLLFLGAHREKKVFLIPALVLDALFILYCILYLVFSLYHAITGETQYFGVAVGFLISIRKMILSFNSKDPK